jgi:hypothetical protein
MAKELVIELIQAGQLSPGNMQGALQTTYAIDRQKKIREAEGGKNRLDSG